MPIRRWLRKEFPGEKFEQWLGISMDEYQRMKESNRKYITHRWPLIELEMTRWDCARWLLDHGLEVPVRSSCVFCPFHDKAEWQGIRNSEDWDKAIELDQAIRKIRPPFDLFIHQRRIPLDQVDLRTPEDKGQLSLWDNECAGVCGV